MQRNVGRNDLVELAYLGSSAHRLPNVVDMGQCRPTPDLYCDPGTRPWPRYGLMLYQDGAGNSSNEAFIAKYEHRMDRGLNLRFEYTFGKALSDSWQAANVSANQVTDCRRCSKGPATFDTRHRAVTSVSMADPLRTSRRLDKRSAWRVDGYCHHRLLDRAADQPQRTQPDGKPIHHPSSGSYLRRAQRPALEQRTQQRLPVVRHGVLSVAARGLLRE